MEWYIEKSGKRRPGIERMCGCGVTYITRADRPSKKCRKGCFGNHVSVTCAWCGIEFARKPSKLQSKSGLYFCGRGCKDRAQCLGGLVSIMPDHYGTSNGREAYKRLIQDTSDPACAGCGETKRYLLVVHHVDGDHDNNVPSNWEIVCANCHVRRHLKEEDGVWMYSPHALTPRYLLSSF